MEKIVPQKAGSAADEACARVVEPRFQIDVRLADPSLEPKFRPIIEKIENLGREVTGFA